MRNIIYCEHFFIFYAGIVWKDIEAMLVALGAEISEGSGSRVRIALNDVRAVFHRPHPQTDKGAVVSMRRFLKEAGVICKKITSRYFNS